MVVLQSDCRDLGPAGRGRKPADGAAVSADGSTFFDGVIVDHTKGIVDRPRLPRFKGYAKFDNHVPLTSSTKIAINNTDANVCGVKLGNPNEAETLRRAGQGAQALREAVTAGADAHAAALAAELNARGMKTRRGGNWQVSTARNLLARLRA